MGWRGNNNYFFKSTATAWKRLLFRSRLKLVLVSTKITIYTSQNVYKIYCLSPNLDPIIHFEIFLMYDFHQIWQK